MKRVGNSNEILGIQYSDSCIQSPESQEYPIQDKSGETPPYKIKNKHSLLQ
jgi:hypothetical protein